MKSATTTNERYCPLCGEDVFDTEKETLEGITTTHYFLCGNKMHSTPLRLSKRALRNLQYDIIEC